MTASSPEDAIRQDIERTRAQLGETVEALAHKADVPARVKDKVHETQQTVQANAEQVAERVLTGTEVLFNRAGEVAIQAEGLVHQALEKLPPPVAGRIEPLVAAIRQRPLPAAAVAVGVLWVLGRLLRTTR
jgi:hypothetical protein